MVHSLLGRQAVLNLQGLDGYAMRAPVVAVNLEFTRDQTGVYEVGSDWRRSAVGSLSWEMLLRGTGDMVLTAELLREYQTRFTSQEWRCDYCGSPQERARLHCKQCGGPRSFLYELMDRAAREWWPNGGHGHA